MPSEKWPRSQIDKAQDNERFLPLITEYFHEGWSGVRANDMVPELGGEIGPFRTWLKKAIGDGTLNREKVAELTNYSPESATGTLTFVWDTAFADMEQKPDFPSYDPEKGLPHRKSLAAIPAQGSGGPASGPPTVGPPTPGPPTPGGPTSSGPPRFPGPRTP